MVDAERMRYMTSYTGHLARHSVLHPVDGAERIRGRVDLRIDRRLWQWSRVAPPDVYGVAEDWQARLHAALNAPWPCRAASEFDPVWGAAVDAVRAAGARPGARAYGGWADGDRFLAQAAWCLVEHLRPATVVETGVAHGVLSSVILDRLLAAEHGHLWSIDLPEVNPTLKKRTGVAVPAPLRSRWTYVEGSSHQRLPGVLANLPDELDIFVHDSLHSEKNVRFELDAAWERLRPGGVVLVDDIHVNFGFHWFVHTARPAASFAAPFSQAVSRSGEDMWGFAIKPGGSGHKE